MNTAGQDGRLPVSRVKRGDREMGSPGEDGPAPLVGPLEDGAQGLTSRGEPVSLQAGYGEEHWRARHVPLPDLRELETTPSPPDLAPFLQPGPS